MKALYTILKPIVTEKATQMSEKQTYGFYIHPNSTKIDVKMAIKEMYGHDVDTVRIMITPVKKRQLGRRVISKRTQMKKAFITLKGRQKLDITKFGKESGASGTAKVAKTPAKKAAPKKSSDKEKLSEKSS